jgi:hypothetical protein
MNIVVAKGCTGELTRQTSMARFIRIAHERGTAR